MFKKIFLISLIIIPALFGFYKYSFVKINTSSEKININAVINPKLFKIKNDYYLKNPQSLIPQAYASDNTLNPSSYVVVDYSTGKVIDQKNFDKALPIASVTKIMTAMVALDLAKPDEEITISQNAQNQIPTKIGVIAGQKMKVSELIQAMLLVSANDATQALKDGIDAKYGQSVFIEAMNKKAKFLGLKNTSFENPQGFDSPKHYSSAADLAVLSHYALENYSFIRQTVAKDYIFLAADKYHKQFDLQNWNGLLDVYPGADGIKIGNTENAGYTTIVTADRNGKKILAVILGAPGILERDMWASQLLDEGFDSFGIPKVNVTEDDLREKYATWKYW